ncbi:uncharacterized protein N7482_007564 [Penicillium canariense]|uniref:NACHT domain-containing protein n=1 Tax=Penicillium canariense TaxID=189055 RepID=A0A9W9HZT1_9EURO|nr:uncharacterized protein N7482_007564 [Penicillium canariense]KAJ5160560.1 hypothetical protein N7482_007564 [Penicillium canariense]
MSHYDKYTVGWICALSLEMAASNIMLDKTHNVLEQPQNDPNSYIYGEIGSHHIVIACLPDGVYGTISAANVAAQMTRTFRNLQYRFMVGIGAGIPSESTDIRLGDVVVSKPTSTFGGIVNYDSGKLFSSEFQRIGTLNKPPPDMLMALSKYRSLAEVDRIHESPIQQILSKVRGLKSGRGERFAAPSPKHDRLFQMDYEHESKDSSCHKCDSGKTVSRPQRKTTDPVVHYGIIASGDTLLKNATMREQLRLQYGALCVDMESAGLVDSFSCLVIRGISDYADSHKNNLWQPYAAVVAAAYTKSLLQSIPQRIITAPLQPAIEIGDGCVVLAPWEKFLRSLEEHNPLYERNRIQEQSGGVLKASCEWILSDHGYKTWETRKHNSLLWIHGEPGKGKTILSLGIIERLSKELPSGYLAYFFCQNPRFNQVTDILKGILHALLCENPSIEPQVYAKYARGGACTDSNEVFFLGEFFLFILNSLPAMPTFLLIDGLDVCQKDLQYLFYLVQQTLSQLPHVKWLISSRNDHNIARSASRIKPMTEISLELNDNRVSEAVESYLEWQTFEFFNANVSMLSRGQMLASLRSMSQGTYLWAQFACKELRSLPYDEQPRFFTETPTDLEDMYRMMIQKLEETLIPEDLDETIFLIHESARAYLRKKILGTISADMHAEIASQSIFYLSGNLQRDICNLRDPSISVEQVSTKCEKLKNIRYASLYWVDHLSQADALAENRAAQDRGNEIEKFLQNFFLPWVESIILLNCYSKGICMVKTLKRILQVMDTPNKDETPLPNLTLCEFQKHRFPDLYAFLNDAEKFMLWSRDVVEEAPLQLYISALAFAPRKSIIKLVFQDHLPPWFEFSNDLHDDWYQRPLVPMSPNPFRDSANFVTYACFSPDSNKILCGNERGQIQAWDVETLRVLGYCSLHSEPIIMIKCSHNGQLIASITESQIRVLSISDFESCVTLDGYPKAAKTLVFSQDSNLIAIACTDFRICVWCTRSGAIQAELAGHVKEIDTLEFIPCSRRLLSICVRKTAIMWDIDTEGQIWALEGYVKPHKLPAPSPGTTWPICTLKNNCVGIHDPFTAKAQWSSTSQLEVRFVLYRPLQLLVRVFSNGSVDVWNLRSFDLVFNTQTRYQSHVFLPDEVAVSPNARYLALGSRDGVDIWDCFTGTSKQDVLNWREESPKKFRPSIKYLPNNLSYVELYADLWKIDPSKIQPDLPVVPQSSQDPFEQFRVAIIHNRNISIRDRGNPERYVWLCGHISNVKTVTLSESGSFCLSTSEDGAAYLWEVPSLHLEPSLADPELCASPGSSNGHSFFSPDNKLFVTIAGDIRIDNVQQRKRIFHLRARDIEHGKFSNDSKYLVFFASSKYLGLWNAETNILEWVLPFEAGPQEVVHSPSWAWLPKCRILRCWGDDVNRKEDGHAKTIHTINFSANNRWLMTSDGETIRLRDPATGKLQSSFESASSSPLRHALFTSDGKYVISLEGERSTRLIEVETGTIVWTEQISTTCNTLHPNKGMGVVPVAALNSSLPCFSPPFSIIDGSTSKDYGPSAVLSPHDLLVAVRMGAESIHIRTVKKGELLCELKFSGQSILDFTFIDEGDKISVLLEFHDERELLIFKSRAGQLPDFRFL